MQACTCGSRRFKITARYQSTDFITLTDDNGNFTITDTEHEDGEWDDESVVTCLECDESTSYAAWEDGDEEEEE